MALFKNKYRIESARLPSWDYRWNAAYYVTICTKGRMHHFGEIEQANLSEKFEMHMNEIGRMAFAFWKEIPQHFPFAHLDEFVIMPNHIHGIIIIEHRHFLPKVPKIPESRDHEEFFSRISPKQGSLSSVIRSYKSIVTRECKKINSGFGWQPRFYDTIIRDQKTFYAIRNYILNNPQNWKNDGLNKSQI